MTWSILRFRKTYKENRMPPRNLTSCRTHSNSLIHSSKWLEYIKRNFNTITRARRSGRMTPLILLHYQNNVTVTKTAANQESMKIETPQINLSKVPKFTQNTGTKNKSRKLTKEIQVPTTHLGPKGSMSVNGAFCHFVFDC